MLPPQSVLEHMNPFEHPFAQWLEQLEHFGRLPAADRQAVLDLPHRLRRLDAGAYLVREGDIPRHCAVLAKGYAFRQKLTGSGARQIMAVCIPGDAVDLQNMFLDVSDHSVQLLTQASVADIPREALQQLVRNRPAVGTAVIAVTLVEILDPSRMGGQCRPARFSSPYRAYPLRIRGPPRDARDDP